MSVTQSFILAPCHDPTCSIFVLQEALKLNDDFFLPPKISTHVPNYFPKMKKLVEKPLDNQSRFLYT